MKIKGKYNQMLNEFAEDDQKAAKFDEDEFNLKNLIAYNIELDGIDHKDYPDYCDAYVISAEHLDGQEFTDQELDYYNENYGDEIYDEVIKQIF